MSKSDDIPKAGRLYKIVNETLIWDDFVQLTQYDVDLATADGTWARHKREIHDHGSGAICLLHNPATDRVLLTRQLRLPLAFQDPATDGLSIEAPGGLLDGSDALTRVQAELLEETGYRAQNLEQIYDLFSSPGAITERIILFLGTYSEDNKIAEGGGLATEGEHIEVLHVPFDEAFAMCRNGRIRDAKTVILMQELALRRRHDI